MAGRPVRDTKPLNGVLPRTRCTSDMQEIITAIGQELNVNSSDIIRACISHMLGLSEENSDLVHRMMKAASKRLVQLRLNQLMSGPCPGRDENLVREEK